MKIRGLGRLQRIARRISNRFVSRAIILLYHRVADLPLDPQLLCVNQRNFAEHLEVVREQGQAIQIRALGQSLQRTNRGQCSVIVTFDDGYADNLHNAKPLLEKYNVPATVFVTAGCVGSTREFWYDDLERIFLCPGALPEVLQFNVNGSRRQWELGPAAEYDNETYRTYRGWNVGRKENPTLRHFLYRFFFELLRPLPDVERQNRLDYLRQWAGMDAIQRPTHRTLSADELLRLADGGLIEIGAHTVTHPVLAAIPLGMQKEEIYQSKTRLERILTCPVTSFAYPFGGRSHYTDETVAVVRESGFESACSTSAGVVCRGTDRWQLPRFVVRDWDGNQFARYLKGWINA
jgi:peptidoglycan/xylan/chitin deacetylase (PgdA/CDA1 family)